MPGLLQADAGPEPPGLAVTPDPPVTLNFRSRPLTAAERRALRGRMDGYGRHEARAGRAAGGAAALVIGALWLLTMAVTDEPWLLVTVVWLVTGIVVYLWVRRDLRREVAHLPALRASLGSALERNEARVLDVQARAYAEFEEFEDEGACFAFQLDGDRLLFLSGQEFYPTTRFPSLDFSIVCPLDQHGREVELWIEKRGDAARPERVVPASVKWELAEAIPDSMAVIQGTVDRLEEVLRERAPT